MFEINIDSGEVNDPLQILPEEFDIICRLCLKKNSTTKIFDKKQKNGGKFKDLLGSLGLLNAEENDGLPQKICKACATTINEFYFFKEQINAVQVILNVAMGKVRIGGDEAETSQPDEVKVKELMTNFSCKNTIEIEYHDLNIDLLNSNTVKSESTESEPKYEYQCRICEERFEKRKMFLKHRSTEHHKKLRPKRPCAVCQKWFTNDKLKDHMNIHTDVKPYECDTCSKTFRSRANLYVHKISHKAVKPHVCSVCGKGFVKSTDLERHVKLHDKAGIVCHVCGHVSTTNRKFLIHQKMHESNKVARTKFCPICQKYFKSYQRAKIHMRCHTGEKPYTCRVCNKGFSQQGQLGRHMSIHTGEKPHVCDFCGRCFSLKGNLQQHIMTHTGERPHQCDVCQKTYLTNSRLTQHKFTHERDYLSDFDSMEYQVPQR